MAYSSDLRKRVLAFIEAGGKKTEACRQFSIARATLYTWLNAEDPLAREKPGPRGPRTLDLDALKKHVADFRMKPRQSVRSILVSRSFAFTTA